MLNKILNLERPFVILDVETTGLNPQVDRIIEVAVEKHYPDRDTAYWSTLVNPGIPIKNQGSHQIRDEDVQGKPSFDALAVRLAESLTDVDLAGHNIEFDIAMMRAEMLRSKVQWNFNGHIVCTLKICRLKIPHTLQNAYKRFVDPKGFENAHEAGVDVKACREVLMGQLTEFTDLSRNVADLATFCENRSPNGIDKSGKFVWINDQPCINFGKHRGTPLKMVDKNYLIWMINTPNFPDDAILIAGAALKGEYPKK